VLLLSSLHNKNNLLILFTIMKDSTQSYDIWSDKLPIPILALSIVIFTIYKWELCILITDRKEKNTSWSALPVWIVKRWFSLEQNFDIILKEKTWITWVYKEQLYTFWDDVNQDPNGHVVAVSYYALVKAENFLSEVDFKKVNIVTLEQFKELTVFYKHQEVVEMALAKLKNRLWYTDIVKNILPKKFRISQMRNIYEIILWKKLDRRNFQKKIFSLKIIEDTGEKDTSTSRIAKLYQFTGDKKLNFIDIL